MNLAKLDAALRRALQHGGGPFPILVRFQPPIAEADARALGLTARGDLATGRATSTRIEELADRDDVVSIALVPQPSAKGKRAR